MSDILTNAIFLLIGLLIYKFCRWLGMEEGMAAVMVLFSYFDSKYKD